MPQLTNLKVGEVSFCKRGMNQHARVALFKSMPQGAQAIAKATFQEALEGNMIAGAVNEAFYQSFDGLWERNDAFRAALADEFAEGGDGTTASADYVASVKSLVDEAVAAARAAGATAADTGAVDKAFTEAATNWLANKSQPEENVMPFATKAALLASVAKFDPAKTTVAEVAEIQKAATEFGCEADLPVALAKSGPDPELAKALTEIAVLKMDQPTRTYYDGLDAAGQTAFLAKSADDQAATVEKANATDPVVYKTKDGIEIRKSDGAAALALAKSNDALRADVAKLTESGTTQSLETRAAAYPAVAKATAISLLKTADQLGLDTDAGKDVIKSLGVMQKQASGRFAPIGSTEEPGAGDTNVTKARGDFEDKVAAIAKRDTVDRATAMSKARDEAPDLFAAAYPASVKAGDEDEA